MAKAITHKKHLRLQQTLFVYFVMSVTFFFSQISIAQDQTEIKPKMHQFLSEIIALQPFLISDESFAAEKNKSEIESRILSLNKLAVQAALHSQLQKIQFRFSRQALQDQFSTAYQAFEFGNKSYAREALQSSPSICMSCHTQMPAKSRPAEMLVFAVEKPILPENIFKQSELVFMMWDFDWALALYGQMIAEYPKNKLSSPQITTALERKLTIYARTKRDPKGAIASFQNDLLNRKLPASLQSNIHLWINEFKSWAAEPKYNAKSLNDVELNQLIAKNKALFTNVNVNELVRPNLVQLLKLSGILYEYLNTHPDTKLKPEILYWLGICDSQLKPSSFYSLSDLYFKECILSYPEDPFARRCFDEYKKNTLSHYMIHNQNRVPKAVELDLKKLEQSLRTKI